jgi:signal transduction histidine kinase/ligand-binding sensor domain-containing protein
LTQEAWIKAANVNLARSVVVSFLLSLLAVCPARAVDPGKRISQYGHTAWRIQDGYFGGMPNWVTQTKDGYIWVGTEGGLYRFDGVRFVPWSSLSREKLPSSGISYLFAARDGSLWIATDRGLSHWANQHLTTYKKDEGWIFGDIIEDREGRIWFTHYRIGDRTQPLCEVIDTTEVRCYGSQDGVPPIGIGALVQDTLGNFWLGGSAAILRWRPGSSQLYKIKGMEALVGTSDVGAMATAADGSLWVGMRAAGKGLGLQHMVDGVLQPYVAPNLNGETLKVHQLLLDRQNALWVGTAQGIYRIRGSEVDHYGSGDGLSGDFAIHFFEDREGNLWVPTTKGLDMFRDLSVSTFSKSEGLSGDAVDAVLASRNGTVWFGNQARVEALSPNGVLDTPNDAPRGNQSTNLFQDHTGRLWAGMDNTLWTYQGGKFTPFKKDKGKPFGVVMGMAEDTDHNIWAEIIGTPATLIRIRDMKVQEEIPVPLSPFARKIVADAQSGIWLGLMTGDLARYRAGKVETFHFPDHIKARVVALTRTPNGAILGATGFGIIGWKDGKTQILSISNGLPCDDYGALISDNFENLWLYGECGLVEIPKDEVQRWWDRPEGKVKSRVFDALDGVQPGLGHFNTSSKTPDGRLWFANASVAQVIDPAHIASNTLVPPVYVNAVIADRKSYSTQDRIRLPPRTRDVEIDYTALSFAVPQKVLFRHMLEGRDTDWQDAGTRREAFYTNLVPGRYRFRVIACNNDGVWNKAGATLSFNIAPAWFQTIWFRLLCAVIAILIIWTIYRLRVKQIAQAMSDRFDERLSERTRIARDLHDTLLQTIQGSKLVADSALKQSPDPNRMRGALEQLSAWLGRATEEGRVALNSLRTSTTETNDLADAFRRSIGECQIHGSMEASFSVVGEVSEMHPIVRDEVYRIGYEAIRNACVHSQAAHLQVELTYAVDLILRVRDNGVGIDPVIVGKGKEGHFGLEGMRERARRITAKLTVETSTLSGTEIKLVVPGSIIYRKTNSDQRKSSAIRSLLKQMCLTSNSADS